MASHAKDERKSRSPVGAVATLLVVFALIVACAAIVVIRPPFAEGILQSAFWHRFALTAHSAIAQNPGQFGIELLPGAPDDVKPLFARNEIGYIEKGAPDWGRIGPCLETAVYNFMQGRGLDVPARKWISTRGHGNVQKG